MHFNILTLFPEAVEPYLAASILGKAREAGILATSLYNIRDFASDKHKTVDDTPYGGGAGMVMKVEPIDLALKAIKPPRSPLSGGSNNNSPSLDKGKGQGNGVSRVVVLSARGTPFTQAKAEEYATLGSLTLICGRYEGMDQRVADHLADEELSIGPYVLAGGELAALVVLEAVARLLPGVLGNPASLSEESFTKASEANAASEAREASIEYPQYTKPENYQGWNVPPVLLSGNHEEIRKWREAQRKDS